MNNNKFDDEDQIFSNKNNKKKMMQREQQLFRSRIKCNAVINSSLIKNKELFLLILKLMNNF